MVTVNTVEDLIAAIKSDPQLLDQVQRAILTDKLLGLPEQFAEMLQTQNRMLQTQEEMLADIADLRKTQNRMLQTQEEMLADIADLRKTQNRMLQTQEEMLADIADLRKIQNGILGTQNEMLADIADLRNTQNGMLQTQREMLRTQESMLLTQEKMLADISDLRRTQNELLRAQNEILQRLGNVEAHNGRLSNDFGAFRGNYAESAARKEAHGIALKIGERRGWTIKVRDIAVLRQKDLVQLADDERFDALPADIKISFLKTDVAVQFATSEGTLYYIMVEASYTCDSRDTARAMSHSRMLSQYTGIETFPVISGVRLDREIQPLIDSGDVFWHPIEEQTMEPEEPN